MIIPAITNLSKPYWDGAREGKLLLQHCPQCQHCQHPPTLLCPRCHNTKPVWRQASGRGVIYSFSITEQAAHVAFAAKTPYPIALLELEEGPLMLANIRCDDFSAIAIGKPVSAIFEKLTDAITLPQFQLS